MKQKLMLRGLSWLLALTLLFAAAGCTNPPAPQPQPAAQSVVLLYTNDIHAYMDNDESGTKEGLTYAHLAQMKQDLQKQGQAVLVADAGDHVQGAVYGALDEGETVLAMMNGIYDVATIGNHEFDYGMENLLSLTEKSSYPYLSCNFVTTGDGKPVLEPTKLITVGEVTVGFVGITTPETISSSTPAYFQDGNGNYLYDILAGQALYDAVQASVDSLQANGADYVIALAHLGVDASSQYTSRDVIANVNGLDALIDGHSHTRLEKEWVTDKAGNAVLLTQTGSYLDAIGKMTLADGKVDTQLVTTYPTAAETVAAMKNGWVDTVNEQLGTKIATLAVPLQTHDNNEKRLVRVSETNVGDFVADAYYYYMNTVEGLNCDVAIINGGGLRAEIAAGDISYFDLKATNPFGNVLCLVRVSGQQLLDALEWGSRFTTNTPGENETGAFLHTAGLIYTVNTATPNTVQSNEDEAWVAGPTGEYRVTDVKIYDKSTGRYVPLDLEKEYTLAGANYTLRNQGDGFTMLQGELVKDYIVEDYMALAAYAKAFTDTDGDGFADISSQTAPLATLEGFLLNYEAVSGSGRITMK